MNNDNNNNFKHELFLGLFNKHYGKDEITLNDLVNRTNLVQLRLDDNNAELADLSEGPFSGVELGEAVEKLAFELQNDADLYNSYQFNLVRCMKNEADADSYFSLEKNELEEVFYNYAEKAASHFLDSFIHDALRNKERNEKRKEKNMPVELEV